MIDHFIRATLFAYLLAFAVSAPSATASIQDAPQSAQSRWLDSNNVTIAMNEDVFGLPARLRDARVILLGEVHGLAHGQILDLAMLKALHRQAGVRSYLGEFDAAQADAFNRLLTEDNAAPTDAVFADWRARGMQWANADFREKLTAIAKWNRTLPPQQRVRFVGVDEIQNVSSFCRWLGSRLRTLATDSTLRNLGAALDDPAYCLSGGAKSAASVAKSASVDPVTREGIATLVTHAKFDDREARIAANVLRNLARHRGRFYGLWGLYHVVQAEVNGTAPMALQLRRAGVSVRTIAILNLDGVMMVPQQLPDGTIGYGTLPYTVDNAEAALVNGIDLFARASKAPLTLFTLTGRSSPFRASDVLTKVGGRFGEMQRFQIDPATAPTGYWADAVVISRASPATRELASGR